jgi:cob(I)alamin adenosyltransferase
MALFTGKGDDGTTKTFACDQRRSKNSAVSEALGNVDELNAFLGTVKLKAETFQKNKILEKSFVEILNEVQQNLFIIQAELASSSGFKITENKVHEIEKIVNTAEEEMPPIKSFFVSGGTEMAATFDFARTIARRAERRVVGAHEIKDPEMSPFSLAYLNRLSSLLYALARLSNHRVGILEEKPQYK